MLLRAAKIQLPRLNLTRMLVFTNIIQLRVNGVGAAPNWPGGGTDAQKLSGWEHVCPVPVLIES